MPDVQLAYQEFVFNQDLAPYEAGLLRKAVMSVTGKNNLLYHNHLGQGFRHAYPLIQYKSLMGKAAILYLGKAVNHIDRLFNNSITEVQIEGKSLSFEIEKIHARIYTLTTHENLRKYDIINWIPLQDQNFKDFQSLESENERLSFLSNLLTANILSFAKGVGWHIDEQVIIKDLQIYQQKWISFKNQKFLSFNVRFKTNVFLPDHIGLGKGAAHNYGVIFPVKKNLKTE